eukprot:scaffold4121_cov381-Prasinococcus_capsulatus_cf.AAC.7
MERSAAGGRGGKAELQVHPQAEHDIQGHVLGTTGGSWHRRCTKAAPWRLHRLRGTHWVCDETGQAHAHHSVFIGTGHCQQLRDCHVHLVPAGLRGRCVRICTPPWSGTLLPAAPSRTGLRAATCRAPL